MPDGIPSKLAVENQLARILASAAFAGGERPARLLRFLVEEALQGRAAQLKESVLAVEVLGRAPGFDSKIDPIARVEVGRLRTRMELYYGSEGKEDDVQITLPKGTYSPVFEHRERPTGPAPLKTSAPILRRAFGACALVALLLAAIYWLRSSPTGSEPPRIKLAMPAPDGTTLHSIAISPDGATVAIAAYKEGVSRLYIRRLDSFAAAPLPGAESAFYPFWSPDSRAIGFFANGKLQVIDLNGGPSRTLCDAPIGRGGTWNTAGDIVFAPTVSGPLYRVSSSGGKLCVPPPWTHHIPISRICGRSFSPMAVAFFTTRSRAIRPCPASTSPAQTPAPPGASWPPVLAERRRAATLRISSSNEMAP